MKQYQSNLNVLLITVRSDIGGGPRQVAEILEFGNRNINYHVAAPDNYHYSEFFRKHSESFIPIGHRKFSIFTVLRLVLFCKEMGIHVVHSHGFGAGIYTKVLNLFGIKSVHTYHGIYLKKDFLSRFKLQIEKSFQSTYQVSISVSYSEKRNMRQAGLKPIVIENGIREEIIKPETKNYSIPPGVIGAISRLHPQKNLAWLIKNAPLVLKQYPNVIFYIAGDGEQKEELISLVKNLKLEKNVHFLGFQDPLEFFEKIDLLISPSIGEGLPYTIIEAMACGVPLIASRVQGHTDLIPEEFLFDLENPLKMVELIQAPCEKKQSFIRERYLINSKIKEIEAQYVKMFSS